MPTTYLARFAEKTPRQNRRRPCNTYSDRSRRIAQTVVLCSSELSARFSPFHGSCVRESADENSIELYKTAAPLTAGDGNLLYLKPLMSVAVSCFAEVMESQPRWMPSGKKH